MFYDISMFAFRLISRDAVEEVKREDSAKVHPLLSVFMTYLVVLHYHHTPHNSHYFTFQQSIYFSVEIMSDESPASTKKRPEADGRYLTGTNYSCSCILVSLLFDKISRVRFSEIPHNMQFFKYSHMDKLPSRVIDRFKAKRYGYSFDKCF